MQFNRRKSLKDPISLRKQANDFWMEGDIYEQLCKCLDQIFKGRKNYFVNGFTPKTVDFTTNIAFYRMNVTDKDGDSHTFFGRVVDADEFDVSQRGGNFRRQAVEEVSAVEAPPPVVEIGEITEPAKPTEPEERPTEPVIEESTMADELAAVKEAMQREIEVETINAEFGEEEPLTKEKVSAKMPKKRTARRKNKKDE